MNAAHWHLVLVHIPIVITPLASGLLLLGLFRDNQTLRRLSFALIIFCGVTTGSAFLTGDGAEEVIENIAGVSEGPIETHEEAAEAVLWLSVISGIMSVIALLPYIQPWAPWVATLTLLLSCTTSAGLAYTGYLGGKIRHPETSADSQVTGSRDPDDD